MTNARNVLSSGNEIQERLDLIQHPVGKSRSHGLLENLIEQPRGDDLACLVIYRPRDRDGEFVVVPMTGRVRALSEDPVILSGFEGRVGQNMRSGKTITASQVDLSSGPITST